jgi:type IV secretory pathway component VirB8
MSHARLITTQEEWDRKHHREERRQRRNEITSRVALFFSLVATIIAFYFMTMVP